MWQMFLICAICFSRKGDTWEGERGDTMPGRSMEEDLSIAGGKSDDMRKEMLVYFFIVPKLASLFLCTGIFPTKMINR